jgi:hypothetical protein
MLTDLFALSPSLCVRVAPESQSYEDVGADAEVDADKDKDEDKDKNKNKDKNKDKDKDKDEDEDKWFPEEDLKSAHFLAPRVTRARDYVLHLLLLLCGPDACATLLPPPEHWTPLEAPLQQRSQGQTLGEMGGAGAAPTAAAPGPVVRRSGLRERTAPNPGSARAGPQAQSGRQISGGGVHFQIAKLHNLMDKEQEQLGRRIVYLWECDRENMVPLTEEALGRHSRGEGGIVPHLWTRL